LLLNIFEACCIVRVDDSFGVLLVTNSIFFEPLSFFTGLDHALNLSPDCLNPQTGPNSEWCDNATPINPETCIPSGLQKQTVDF